MRIKSLLWNMNMFRSVSVFQIVKQSIHLVSAIWTKLCVEKVQEGVGFELAGF